MAVLIDKINHIHKEQKNIVEKVKHEDIQLTDAETEIAQSITSEIAGLYRDEIAQKGFTEDIKIKISNSVKDITKNYDISFEVAKRIEKYVISSITGLGPLENFMKDSSVTEIIVERYDKICIERNGKIVTTKTAFTDEEQLRTVIDRILQPIGRQINLHTPMVDGRLSNGSRVNATIPPVTPDGATLTIRKFAEDKLTGKDYLQFKTLNNEMLLFLIKAVQGRVSMIVSGGTNSGKTTLLNMLSSYIPEDELIITIEDSCELQLNQPHIRRMESRAINTGDMMPVTIQNCVKNALRMRPDRIIVGEIRDGTIVDMMSAMSTGHEGSMSTVHANDPHNLVNSRMPILYSMNENYNFSIESQNVQIAEALYLIVHVKKMKDGVRRITHITEVSGIKDNKILLNDIFYYDEINKMYNATGYVPKRILEVLKTNEIPVSMALFKVKKEGETDGVHINK